MIQVEILPYEPENQERAKELILNGLKEHWGYLDESKNLDLNEISKAYAEGLFLIAWLNNEIVGTGAWLPRSDSIVEVVRMSVVTHLRKCGIGRAILCELCKRAYENDFERVILETTETWQEIIAFYKRFGFRVTHFIDGDVYFELDLKEVFENESFCKVAAANPA